MEETSVKNLYRSDTNKVFAGICGGLGDYWKIDPTVLRLLWILLTVFTGFVPGVIAYILAIFIIPMKPVESTSSH
ncbi:MAG: PspC domain-containing protein [Candidatus Moraniibacteriota bacterium]